jgi:hypothetical protein
MKKKHLISLAVVLIFSFVFTGSTIAIMPPSITVQRVVIPYTAVSSNWWTGLAIHNQSSASETYYIHFYDEAGNFISGSSVTIPAHGTSKDSVQNYADDPADIDGSVSVYIETDGVSDETFSATIFIGNTASSQGFGFQTYWSQEYERYLVL